MKFLLEIDESKDEQIVATVHRRSRLTDEIEALIMQHTGTDRIMGYTDEDAKMLLFSDIECITVLDGKTVAIDRSGACYRLKQRLYELEAVLPAVFIRINKSAIANQNHLERFTASFNGAVDAVFRCGYRDYVSRRCFSAIKRRFDQK